MLKKRMVLIVTIIISITALLAGCKKAQATSVAVTDPQLEVIADLAIIASTDWDGREDQGKQLLSETLSRPEVSELLNDTSDTGKVRAQSLKWLAEEARKATLTRKETVSETVSDGIDTGLDILEGGKNFIQDILEGLPKGGDNK